MTAPPVLDPDAFARLHEDVGVEGTEGFIEVYLGLLDGRVAALQRAVAEPAASADGRLWAAAASLAVASSMAGAAALGICCRQIQTGASQGDLALVSQAAAELGVLAETSATALRRAVDRLRAQRPPSR